MIFTYIAIGLLVAATLWWWIFRRNTPTYQPIEVDDNDPRLLAAASKAKANIDLLRKLHANEPQEVQVKLPFVSNSGVTEYLWAEVLELGASETEVRYLTPPVTHTGKLDRIHTHPISDVEDWSVFLDNGEIHGGYTQRVMFEIARDQYGELPPELAEQETRYVD